MTLRAALEVERKFISSGSTVLDCALGGGYAVGKIINIIGDESTGKTLLAQEAIGNFQLRDKNAEVCFDDAEAALDVVRMNKVFGADLDRTHLQCSETVQAFSTNCLQFISHCKKNNIGGIYVLDSLDAIGTEDTKTEKQKNKDDHNIDYSMRKKLEKAGLLPMTFEKLNKKLAQDDVTLFVISQMKTKIGVMFGDTATIAGGKSLRFYACQRLKLAQIGTIVKTEGKVKKIIGIKIKVKVIKNKVSEPFHEAIFKVYFNKGIDDLESCIDFIREHSNELGTGKQYKYGDIQANSMPKFKKLIREHKKVSEIKKMVRKIWQEKIAI